MSELKTLTALAESLVSYARKKGADEVEVSISNGSEFTADVRKGEIEKLVEAGSKALSMRVFKDNKTANLNSSDFNKDTLFKMVDSAVKRAELSSPDPFAGLPDLSTDEQAFVDYQKLDIFDPTIIELGPEKKIALAKQTEALCLQDDRITTSYGAGFGNYFGENILVNSNGFSGAYMRTSCSLGVYLQSGEGDKRVEDGWYEGARYFKDLWQPEQIAKTAIDRVTRMIGAKKVASQNVPVVLEPGMTASILWFLYSCINGRSVYLNQSYLVDQLGESIAHSGVNLVDDGLLKGGPGTKPFDSEGVPVKKLDIIKNGTLQTYLADVYAARKLDMKPTGHASGPNNLILEKGAHSPEDIIKSVDNGLLLTGTMGQGTNPSTGDFSRGAFGMWIENGEIAYPVSEITINGNLDQMLKNMDLIGNDLRIRRSISGPTVRIAEMTVAGT
jgi:PmbA protein